MSSWDFDTLDEELKALEASFNMEDLGFEEMLGDLEEEESGAHDDDFDEDEFIPENPESKTGDLFVLGEHRLLCGDSSKKELVDYLIGDASIDLLLTDPPYNVDYEGKTAEALKIDNDSMSNDEFREFLRKCFANANSHMRKGASFYIWFADKKAYWVQGAMLDVGWEVKQMPIWNKDSMVLGRNHYQFKHEPCFYGWKEGAASTFVEARNLTTVWDFERPKRSLEHPTMKPLELFGFLIENSSLKGDNVLDLFGGSGTTLITCEQTNRRCFIVEKLPKYVDVIVKRYLRYKGSSDGCYLIRNGEKMELPQEYLNVIEDTNF